MAEQPDLADENKLDLLYHLLAASPGLSALFILFDVRQANLSGKHITGQKAEFAEGYGPK